MIWIIDVPDCFSFPFYSCLTLLEAAIGQVFLYNNHLIINVYYFAHTMPFSFEAACVFVRFSVVILSPLCCHVQTSLRWTQNRELSNTYIHKQIVGLVPWADGYVCSQYSLRLMACIHSWATETSIDTVCAVFFFCVALLTLYPSVLGSLFWAHIKFPANVVNAHKYSRNSFELNAHKYHEYISLHAYDMI